MPDIPFTPEQMERLRKVCGFRREDRELTADDVVVLLEARAVVEAERRRWSWREGP